MPEVIYQGYLHISERVNESGVAESHAITVSRSQCLDEMPDCDTDGCNADNEVTGYDSSSDGEETETDVSELNKESNFLVWNDYAIWAPRQVFL